MQTRIEEVDLLFGNTTPQKLIVQTNDTENVMSSVTGSVQITRDIRTHTLLSLPPLYFDPKYRHDF